MYYIRQACTISDMHVLYPTCMYYIRHAYTISDSYVFYPKLPILYPTVMYYIRYRLYSIRHALKLHPLSTYIHYPQFNEFNGHSLTCPQNTKIVIYYSSKNHFFPTGFYSPSNFYSSRRRCLGTPRIFFLFPSSSPSPSSVRSARSLQKGHLVIFFPFFSVCVCVLGIA